jgi:hypothetical protein
MVAFPSTVTTCIRRSRYVNSEILFRCFIGDLYGLNCSTGANIIFFHLRLSPLHLAPKVCVPRSLCARSSKGYAWLFVHALISVDLSISLLPIYMPERLLLPHCNTMRRSTRPCRIRQERSCTNPKKKKKYMPCKLSALTLHSPFDSFCAWTDLCGSPGCPTDLCKLFCFDQP